MVEELARLNPAELLLPDNEQTLGDITENIPAVSRLPNWRFEEGNARRTLTDHFNVSTLAGFGCEGKPQAVRAAGALMVYLQETQKGATAQIQRLATYSTEGFMALDVASRRNLELTEALDGNKNNSLLGVLDKAVTPMGKRLLHQRITRPLLNVARLNERLDLVSVFFGDGLLRAEIRALLKPFPDLERLTNRAVNGSASPRDLENIGWALAAIPKLQTSIQEKLSASNNGQNTLLENLGQLTNKLDHCLETADLINRAIQEEAPANLNKPGVIKAGFSAELDGVMNSSAHAREWVNELEPSERERTGINSLKVGFNKVFGYYIEVTKANTKLVPEDYIRKQTLTNSERYITPELKEYETLILNAEERIIEIERRVFTEVCQQVGRAAGPLLANAAIIAQLDVAAALAEVAANQNYVRPELSYENSLDIRGGRHPVVERSLVMERFVPNNCCFDDKERIQIITGPNMSGKSTYLRQVALIVLMAQIGSFVPAERASIGLADRIFTRIGAHDELHAGRSTFMVEMVETAEILNHAGGRSLLILDEIGRGTSTYDGSLDRLGHRRIPPQPPPPQTPHPLRYPLPRARRPGRSPAPRP